MLMPFLCLRSLLSPAVGQYMSLGIITGHALKVSAPGWAVCQSFCMIKHSFNFLSFNNGRISVQSICKSWICAFDTCEICSCQNLSFFLMESQLGKKNNSFACKTPMFCDIDFTGGSLALLVSGHRDPQEHFWYVPLIQQSQYMLLACYTSNLGMTVPVPAGPGPGAAVGWGGHWVHNIAPGVPSCFLVW